MKFSDKEKDSTLWLYTHGVDAEFIAGSLSKDGKKCEWTDVANMIWDILRGVEPFPPIATQAAMDRCDWSLRHEYILRTMASFNLPPSKVADLLGRGKDQCKRKLLEMKERDKWLSDYAIKRRLTITPPHTGGVPFPQPKKQGTFFDDAS